MKPTPQITRNQHAARSFPLTDYSFQPTVEASANTAAALPDTKKPRAFYKMSSEFFATETHLDYIAELFFFILIAGVAAWPVLSMLACLAWMKIVFSAF
jgi:hypothetical protein